VEVDIATHGPDHPKVATDLDALAAVQEQQGNADDAIATRAQAQRIRDLQQRIGPDRAVSGSSPAGTEPG
jgi:hypothetical protein